MKQETEFEIEVSEEFKNWIELLESIEDAKVYNVVFNNFMNQQYCSESIFNYINYLDESKNLAKYYIWKDAIRLRERYTSDLVPTGQFDANNLEVFEGDLFFGGAGTVYVNGEFTGYLNVYKAKFNDKGELTIKNFTGKPIPNSIFLVTEERMDFWNIKIGQNFYINDNGDAKKLTSSLKNEPYIIEAIYSKQLIIDPMEKNYYRSKFVPLHLS